MEDSMSAYSPWLTYSQPPTSTLPAVIAARLSDGEVIGLYNGRSETGARALGHRSIVADPRLARTHYINKRVKIRESFRPLAPSVLAEEVDKWFVNPGREDCSPFMSLTLKVREEVEEEIPGVVHVDGTARLQTVVRGSGFFRKVIEAFFERTGVPMVVNTSFNVGRGEPIVESVRDALDSFRKSELDCVVVEEVVVERKVLGRIEGSDR